MDLETGTMGSSETTADNPTERDVRSKREIYADLRHAETIVEEMFAKAFPLLENLSVIQEEALREVMVLMDYEDIDELTYNQSKESQVETFKDGPLEELAGVCLSIADARRKLSLYQREYLPHKTEELRVYTRQLSARLNYAAMIAYHTAEAPRTSSGLLIHSIHETQFLREIEFRLEAGDKTMDYHRIQNYEENLKTSEIEWQDKGFLMSSGEYVVKNHKPSFDAKYNKSVREETMRNGRGIVAELKRNRTISEVYKPSYNFFDYRDRAIEEVLRCLDRIQRLYGADVDIFDGADVDIFDETDYDFRFIQAARDFFYERKQALGAQGKIHMDQGTRKKYLEVAQHLDENDIVSKVKIEGISKIEGRKLVITQDNITKLLSQIPPHFIEGIEIIVANTTYDKSKSYEDPNYETVGHHTPQYDNQGNYVSSRIEVYRPINTDEDANELLVLITQKEFIDTLTHEIGHKILYGLVYEEMSQWEDVIEKDPTAITWYVKHSRDQSEPRGKREDFCESFMMYYSNPAVLIIVSAERFQYMNRLIQDYLPPDKLVNYQETLKLRIASQIMQWRDNNYSIEDIRDMYLS